LKSLEARISDVVVPYQEQYTTKDIKSVERETLPVIKPRIINSKAIREKSNTSMVIKKQATDKMFTSCPNSPKGKV